LTVDFVRFLDSLIFNDEVDAYQNWTLFLIFASILVLISGVVLLTHKKPEPSSMQRAPVGAVPARKRALKAKVRPTTDDNVDSEEEESLRVAEEGDVEGEERHVMWQIGDASDDDDEDAASGSGKHHEGPSPSRGVGDAYSGRREGVGLMKDVDHDDDHEGEEDRPGHIAADNRHRHRRSASSDATIAVPPPRAGGNQEEFGEWKDGQVDNAL
jgi:magnesium transporter